VTAKPETNFRKRVRAALDRLPNTYVMSVQQVAIRGDADLIICIKGLFIALELKRRGGRSSKLQDHKLAKINAAGGYAAVVSPDNWPAVYATLEGLAA